MSAKINTLFYWCNDVVLMREFYSDILGLSETYFQSDNDVGWLTYDVDGIQVVFIRGSSPFPIESGWAKQPSWTEGTREVASIVLDYSLDDFKAVVERAKAEGLEVLDPQPGAENAAFQKRFVMDPMGATVELSYPGEQG